MFITIILRYWKNNFLLSADYGRQGWTRTWIKTWKTFFFKFKCYAWLQHRSNWTKTAICSWQNRHNRTRKRVRLENNIKTRSPKGREAKYHHNIILLKFRFCLSYKQLCCTYSIRKTEITDLSFHLLKTMKTGSVILKESWVQTAVRANLTLRQFEKCWTFHLASCMINKLLEIIKIVELKKYQRKNFDWSKQELELTIRGNLFQSNATSWYYIWLMVMQDT